MNIILFEPSETLRPLPRRDRRAQHILGVLRCDVSDAFDAGEVNGRRGKAAVVSIEEDSLRLEFTWGLEPPKLDPITLIVGLPRPQTARKILEEATALGVEAIHFVASSRGEAGYARSKLWTTDEWRRHLLDGAAQAFSTRLPEVSAGPTLQAVIAELPTSACRLVLDNYEAAEPLMRADVCAPVALAAGPERGWSPEEHMLRRSGFRLVHLGERVLRVETACVAAVALTKAKPGLALTRLLP